MAIIQLDKMTLYGAELQKAEVIARLQTIGCAHLVNIGTAAEDFVHDDAATDARDALKFLRSCPEPMRQVRRHEQFDREQIVTTALRLRDDERDLKDEHDELQGAIQDLEPWGEFKLPAGGVIGDVQFWFYVVPNREIEKLKVTGLAWREVARDHRNGDRNPRLCRCERGMGRSLPPQVGHR